ncbi:MAG: SDR family NAD(P)-dependent oxidoreductase [Alphaproteobacteria bacterium]
MDINGKVAVVTGGASGMGQATIRRVVKAGGKAAVFDINDEKGQKMVDELGEDNVIYCHVNVMETESIEAGIAATIEKFGAIHINCNFAGGGFGGPARTMGRKGPHNIENYKKTIALNLIGTFDVARLCAEQMANNEPFNKYGGRGVIVNTASVAGYEGQIGQAAYSSAKGGIIGMTVPVARDLAVLGIRVNTIVPGLIATPMLLGGAEEMTPEIEQALQPLSSQVLYPKRLGLADEIAALAQHFIENDYINAECVRMDGGIRMQPK